MSYNVVDNVIIIAPKSMGNFSRIGDQKQTVKGKITSLMKEPIPGATVVIKGTSNGTITDADGNYTINNVPVNSTLMFSFVGMKTQEVIFVSQSVINIMLEEETVGIEEVVAIGYGSQVKREITGAISKIGAEELADQPVMQFAQQLQGKLAGVQIGQTSGQPGRGMDFRIRGAASLYSETQPLFVIDGLPVTGSINNINPAEIESFTVLKDASASALYGSRAANGVILITTKHAKLGDSKIEFSSNYGTQVLPENRVPRMMTAREFAQFMKERAEDKMLYEGSTTPVDPAYADPTQYGDGTNWYDLLTRTAPIQSYDLTLQSARERSSSTVIAGYQEQKGVIINTGTKLYSLRLNQDLSLSNNKIKLGFNVALSYRQDHNNRLTTDGVGGLFERIFESSPLIAPYNADGTYTKSVASPGMVAYINPLAQFMLNIDDYNTTRILGNAFFNYEFLPGLELKTNLAADKGGETRNQFTPAAIVANGVATGISSSVDNYSWTAETNLYYTKTFLKDHHIEALIGYSAQKFDQYSNSVSGTGFPSDDVPYISAATSLSAGSSNTKQFSMLSNIGRLIYNYKGKYLLTAAIRRDGSSRFGSNRRYGSFPSVSGGWIVSDENFMKKFKFLDLLKLRASYGITGNNNFPDNYASIAKLGEMNYILNGALVSGQTITTLGNSELGWERNKQFDIGFDMGILNNRISFSYDYYHKMTDGLIQDRLIPRASGFTTIKFNIGVFEFWGHEININTVNLTGNLKWNTNLNISIDRNLIKSLVSPGFIRRNNTVTSDYFRNQEGHHLGEFYGFIFEGLYKDAEDLANSAKYGSASDVGTIKMKDVNNDGAIDDVNDRTFIGDPTPDFNFGLTNEFRYKNFDLNIAMSGSVGGKILNAAKWAYQTNMDGSRMLLAAAADRWRSPENPGSGIYPRTKTGTTAIGRSVNSQWIEDGTYLTAKNISVGYSFNLMNRNMLLKNLRVYGSVQQAFVLTKFTGMNPEIGLSGLDATKGIGVNENAYPIPRTFSIGFTVTFK
ncbi:MAG TPA: TonB-dependent receptor [Prolixibacteraceae bacterium]|nr:TonB-dependent receptor [Prolixibacteraceae bacterium]HCU61245.1 TonB-dependent receptor [Prolixibacteraceae bacterium]